jgi:hypothetical protein
MAAMASVFMMKERFFRKTPYPEREFSLIVESLSAAPAAGCEDPNCCGKEKSRRPTMRNAACQ